MFSLETLTVSDVPVLLRSPSNPNSHTPLILLWHDFSSPNGEADIAEAFPLEQIEAWKAYLGLPLFGQRFAGIEELMNRQMEDYVLRLLLPVIEQAMEELPKVVDGLRSHCNLDSDTNLGLFGFSAGGLAALLTLAESNVPIQAAVLVGVTKDLSLAVATYERFIQSAYDTLKRQYPWLKPEYSWSSESEIARVRLDFANHSQVIVKGDPPPAILFVHGAQDEAFDLHDVEILRDRLMVEYQRVNYPERLSMQVFQHLKHAIHLAANTSVEQQQDILAMEKVIADWFTEYMTVSAVN
jgi:dienelactone hydrolase